MYVKPTLSALDLAVEKNVCCRGMATVNPTATARVFEGTVGGSDTTVAIEPITITFTTPLCPFPVPGSVAIDVAGISAFVSS